MCELENLNLSADTTKKKHPKGRLHTKHSAQSSSPDTPLISIVTVVYNGEKFLEEAITSVIDQDYDNIEYIVIDGGSTDKSLDIIRKHEDQIDYWVSEPDEGQSDAFIKAFDVCNGEWLTWLNGDDILLPGAINGLVEEVRKHPEIDCFTGNIIWTTADNRVIKCRKGEPWLKLLPKLGHLNTYGPSTFFKKELYDRVDGINRKLHYKMDTDLWWQFYREGAKFRRLKQYSWTLRLHENAKMSGHHFEESECADMSHPSWRAKRQEGEYIERKYSVRSSGLAFILGKVILLLCRLLSFAYLSSRVHSKKHAGVELKEFYMKEGFK